MPVVVVEELSPSSSTSDTNEANTNALVSPVPLPDATAPEVSRLAALGLTAYAVGTDMYLFDGNTLRRLVALVDRLLAQVS